jgi:hypothetical protein
MLPALAPDVMSAAEVVLPRGALPHGGEQTTVRTDHNGKASDIIA